MSAQQNTSPDDENAEIVWGRAQNAPKAHAFTLAGHGMGISPDEYRRSYLPRAMCGTAWAEKWPPPACNRRRCRICERLVSAANQ